MSKYHKLDQQKYRQKSDTRDTTCLAINTVKSIDSIDAENSPTSKPQRQKPLWYVPYMSTDDKFLMTKTSYPYRE